MNSQGYSKRMRQQLDPISLQIMWTRLISIANRGAATLLRTAFSTVVGSAEDYKVYGD